MRTCALVLALLAAQAHAESPPTAVQTGPPRRVIAADDSKKTLAAVGLDGMTMVFESGPARIIEIDGEGNLRREVKLTVDARSVHSDIRNAWKTDAGTHLVAHERDGVVREYDADGKIVWEFDVPVEDERKGGHGPEALGDQVYSAVRLASGNTRLVNCHAGPDNPQIIEVTPDKRVAWTFQDFTTFGNSLPVAVVLDP